MKETIISLLIFTSCMAPVSLRKPANIEDDISCHKLIGSFKTFSDVNLYINYSDYFKYSDALTFSSAEQKLEKKIRYWANLGGRENTLEQMRHNGAFSKISNSLKIDSAFSVARQIRPLFYEAELSYFITKRAFRRIKMLENALTELKKGEELSDEVKVDLITDFLENPLVKTTLKKELIEKGHGQKLQRNIQSDIAKLNENLIEYSLRLAKVSDVYLVTRNYLEKVAGEPSELQSEAKKVLDKLATRDILSTCHACGAKENLIRPNINEVKAIAMDFRVTRIKFLETQLLYEKLLTIVALTPTNVLFNIFDNVFQRVPWLNNSVLRKWLRKTFLDHHSILKYFPNIDRILYSNASTEDLVELAHEFSVKGNGNDFLVTFARRLDTQKDFLKIYNWLKENLPSDNLHHHKILFDKMTLARKEALNRGLLPEWHVPKLVNANRIILETVLMGAGAYITYYYEFNSQDVKDTVNDLVGHDILKQEEYQKALEAELDKLSQQEAYKKKINNQ